MGEARRAPAPTTEDTVVEGFKSLAHLAANIDCHLKEPLEVLNAPLA
jgi:hypothetical protein